MLYKTGRFARMMGVGVDTLRYYEHLGLISPKVDEQNGYRLYSDADAFMLLSIKEYRGMGMPVSQVAKLLRGGTIGDQLSWLEAQQHKLDEQIAYLQHLRKRNMQRAQDMRCAVQLGEVQKTHCPPAYHLPYLELDQYPADEAGDMMRKWTGCMPFIGFLITLKPENLRTGRLSQVEPGLKAELKYVDEFRLPLGKPVRLMLGGEGVRVSVAVRNPFNLKMEELLALTDYFQRENVFASDDVTFIVEAVAYDRDGRPTYYMNVACPVKKIS